MTYPVTSTTRFTAPREPLYNCTAPLVLTGTTTVFEEFWPAIMFRFEVAGRLIPFG